MRSDGHARRGAVMSQMPQSDKVAHGPRRRFAAAGIVLSSLLLLLVALGTSAVLLYGALERAQIALLSERFELAGRESATRIEAGLRFGRPLEQFLNLDTLLAETLDDTPGVSAVMVVGAGGARIARTGSAREDAAFSADIARALQTNQRAFLSEADRVFVTALRNREGQVAGHLVMTVPQEVLSRELDLAVTGGVATLLLVSAVAALLLAVAAGRMPGAMAQPQLARWRWMLLPVVVLLGAQVAYSVFVLQTYRTSLAATSVAAAQSIGQRVQQDMNRLLGLGLTFERMPGLQAQLESVIGISDAVERLELRDGEGTLRLNVEAPATDAGAFARLFPAPQLSPVSLPLSTGDGAIVGEIRLDVAAGSIRSGLANQTITIVTVAATSAFFMIELLVLMQILLRRSIARAAEQSVARGVERAQAQATTGLAQEREPFHLLARPVIFGFVFAWALPLSFLPLKMRSLGGELFGLPPDLVLALPISAEMACALITAIIAGRLADVWGWHKPFLAGLLLSAAGGVAAAMASDELAFIGARGLTGLGYGLSWMGIQAFVVQNCPPERRGQALANLMAGILAGFIAGTAVGGIFAEQFGQNAVLLTSGALAFAPLGIAAITLGRHMRPRAPRPDENRTGVFAGWAGLVRSPEYMGVLLLSVVPFSIAQVGLLYFAVPLYIDTIGAAPSDTGRILMVYGVIVILLGPTLSELIDQSHAKLRIVVMGGLVGGLGLAALYADLGLGGIFLAAALLSLSSALIEPARAAFVLGLPAVRRAGLSSALGLQRAADKLGQMIGPLVIAAAFAGSEIVQRVAYVGIGFAVASLLLGALVLIRNSRAGAGEGAKR